MQDLGRLADTDRSEDRLSLSRFVTLSGPLFILHSGSQGKMTELDWDPVHPPIAPKRSVVWTTQRERVCDGGWERRS